MKETCTVCSGSGEVAAFMGVSRFLLTYDACPVCGGLGYVMEETPPPENQKSSGHATAPQSGQPAPSPGKKTGPGK